MPYLDLCSAVMFRSWHRLSKFQGIQRLSNLSAPIMLLTGHEGEVFGTKFSPDGKMLASAGFDRLICE